MIDSINLIENEFNETCGIEFELLGPDAKIFAMFFCQFKEIAYNYGVGLIAPDELKYDEEKGTWNNFWYDIFKKENIDWVTLVSKRDGIVKGKHERVGKKFNNKSAK